MNTLLNLTATTVISVLLFSLFTSNLICNVQTIQPSCKLINLEVVNEKSNSHFATLYEFIFSKSDSTLSEQIEKDKSDLFYYILGILILIASGFILKQRYEQYLKQRDGL
jgi:hypothetical protein